MSALRQFHYIQGLHALAKAKGLPGYHADMDHQQLTKQLRRAYPHMSLANPDDMAEPRAQGPEDMGL